MAATGWKSALLATLPLLICASLTSVSCASYATAHKYPFLREAASAPTTSHYDYIVVGGGAAGCPLAATLSETSKVLLLERGGSPYGDPNITSLSNVANAVASAGSPSSPAQRFASEDGVSGHRARVLGGGTAINFGVYSRAPPEYVAEVGWDAGLVGESYRWVEREVVFEPEAGAWQRAARDGLVEAGVGPDNGVTVDHLVGVKFGGTTFDGNGSRHMASDFLRHAAVHGNLDVLLRGTVHRILFKHEQGEKSPRAHGVVFTDRDGKKHWAYLKDGKGRKKKKKSEIILAAGALGSPQLLMLSGVGPAAHLKSMGISVVLDHPMVGQGMADNPLNGVVVPSPVPLETSIVPAIGITRFGTYIEASTGCGLLAAVLGPSSSSPSAAVSTSAAAGAPGDGQATPFSCGIMLEKPAGPLSTGHLSLKTTDPEDNPEVTFNYFEEEEDLRRCVRGMETIEKVVESKAFARFRDPSYTMQTLREMVLGLGVNSRPKHENSSLSLELYCRDSVISYWHYHGGCILGDVVDRDYRVAGVGGLRVVDASTFKSTPGTNPQATVMMLGRYMGVRINKERA